MSFFTCLKPGGLLAAKLIDALSFSLILNKAISFTLPHYARGENTHLQRAQIEPRSLGFTNVHYNHQTKSSRRALSTIWQKIFIKKLKGGFLGNEANLLKTLSPGVFCDELFCYFVHGCYRDIGDHVMATICLTFASVLSKSAYQGFTS